MTTFNNMTIAAACSILSGFKSHGDMGLLEAEWGISGRTNQNSKTQRAADLAAIALNENIDVMTENGLTSLSRAIIEVAIHAPEYKRDEKEWRKFIAGLRFDGFEITENSIPVPSNSSWGKPSVKIEKVLSRIYPDDVPALDFKEAQSEIGLLLDRHSFTASKGHLNQAIRNFTGGNWASANAQLRSFLESYLRELASRCGFTGKLESTREVRAFLGETQPPLLLTEYNEWNFNEQKPQFISGLWARMNPHGSHPGLSEEDDCAFRLHISLISARLLLRRFDQRDP